MDLETERQYFRCAAVVLQVYLYYNGGSVPGLLVSSDKTEWLIGELDNIIEMRMILVYQLRQRNRNGSNSQ